MTRGRLARTGIAGGGLTLALLSLVACSSTSPPPPPSARSGGAPAAAPGPSNPGPAISASARPCTPSIGPGGSPKAAPALVAVRLALADGLNLRTAVEAVFDVPVTAMGSSDRVDALRVLTALKTCPLAPAVQSAIPPLLALLTDRTTAPPYPVATPSPGVP